MCLESQTDAQTGRLITRPCNLKRAK